MALEPGSSSTPKCSRCAEGLTRKDSTHDKGCPKKWLTVGEHFDELSYDDKWGQFALYRAHGITKATSIKEYSAELYRPKRKRKQRHVTLDPQTSTIQDAKNWLNEAMLKGANCPCCNQKVKVYKRHVTHKQAATLILLHKTFPVGTIVDINFFVQQAQPPEFALSLVKGREWHKLKYWGLIDEVDDKAIVKRFRETYPDSKGKRVSLHQLNERGAAFCQGSPIIKFVYIYDDVVRGWDETANATVMDALEAKFDFNDLINAVVPAVGHIV